MTAKSKWKARSSARVEVNATSVRRGTGREHPEMRTTRPGRCSCAVERVLANRGDRRAAKKAGRPAPQGVQLHQDGCPIAASTEGLMRGRVRAAKGR
jgi:hypothetical protein